MGNTSIIILSLVVAGGLAAIGDVQNGQSPNPSILAGVIIGGFFLIVISDFQPGLARSFALLILVISVVSQSSVVSKLVNTTVGKPKGL